MPSELTCKNMISQRVKRSLLLWLHRKIAPFPVLLKKKNSNEMTVRILHGFLEKPNFTGREISYLHVEM